MSAGSGAPELRAAARSEGLVVVGPTPPPMHGVSAMTGQVLAALRTLGLYRAHVDTRDPRPHETIGKFDLNNVWLAGRHAWQLGAALRRHPGAAVYLPISQGALGFLRDALLVAVARLNRREVLLHFHGADFRRFYEATPAPMRLIVRLTLAQARELWVLTPSLGEVFRDLIPSDRIRPIQNVVPDLDGNVREVVERDARGFRVLYLGNMFPEKNCFDLLAALRSLGGRAAGWRVRIAGVATPEIQHRLLQEVAALNAAGVQVEVVGEVSGAQKTSELRSADLFVYPTAFDGQPLVLLEALAAGLPIISTRHGGIPETVRDGVEGLLVDVGDVAGLSEALQRLADDTRLRGELAAAARLRYQQSYQPDRLARDLSYLLG
jgi:glycosyltransferase involved in cell wall biosynthesis